MLKTSTHLWIGAALAGALVFTATYDSTGNILAEEEATDVNHSEKESFGMTHFLGPGESAFLCNLAPGSVAAYEVLMPQKTSAQLVIASRNSNGGQTPYAPFDEDNWRLNDIGHIVYIELEGPGQYAFWNMAGGAGADFRYRRVHRPISVNNIR